MGKVIIDNQITVNGAFDAPKPGDWVELDFAERVNGMPKYVASRTLTGPLEWNATLIEGEVVRAVPALKEKHAGNLIVSGRGEPAAA